MPPLAITATLVAAALVTSFISGILGMAGGMVFMGLLLALLSVPEAMVLHGITQLASNAWRAILWRHEIDWRVLRGIAAGSVIALSFFVLVQAVASKAEALIMLGVTPFLALALPPKLVLDVRRRGHPLLCGLVCTTLQLTAGVSGPILDVFFVRSQMDRRTVVATKAVTQSMGHLIKIAYFGFLVGSAQRGSVETELAVTMVACAVIGTTLSRRVLERLTDASFRQWTRIAVVTMGLIYIAWGGWLLATG